MRHPALIGVAQKRERWGKIQWCHIRHVACSLTAAAYGPWRLAGLL